MDKHDEELLRELQAELASLSDPEPSEKFVRQVTQGIAEQEQRSGLLQAINEFFQFRQWVAAGATFALLLIFAGRADLINYSSEDFPPSATDSFILNDFEETSLFDTSTAASLVDADAVFLDYFDEA